MKQLGIALLVLALTGCDHKVSAVPAWDGPFGLKIGASLEELKAAGLDIKPVKTTAFSVYDYKLKTPPIRPEGITGELNLKITPKQGLCTISVTARGTAAEFSDAITSKLIKKYGDYIDATEAINATAKESGFDIRYVAHRKWKLDSHSDVVEITQTIQKTDENTYMSFLTYNSKNSQLCERISLSKGKQSSDTEGF